MRQRELVYFLSVFALALAGCGGPETSENSAKSSSTGAAADGGEESWPEPPSQKFAGSTACVECHEDVAKEYASHPMSRSFAKVLEASPLESYEDTEFSVIDHKEYRVEKVNGEVIHYERKYDKDGEILYDQGMRVEYAVGSGIRGRTYLLNNDGRICASPISWFAEDRDWALSPGYSERFHYRFERRVSEGCLACHVGRVQMHAEGEVDRFDAEKPFLEDAIGCERCHGPGEEHIEYRRADQRSGEDPIVNPIAFDDARRDAVCSQCHLQGTRRVVRLGRTEFDFRPGDYVSDIWTVFLKDVTSEDSVAVSQVEQMYESECFKQSSGALGCISCHDPHRTHDEKQAPMFFREKCQQCHSDGETTCSESHEIRMKTTPEDSCIVCHMPKFPASDVHASQTDHRVLKLPKATSSSTEILTESRDPKLYVEPDVTVPKSATDRAFGIALAEKSVVEDNDEMAERAIKLLLNAASRSTKDYEARLALGEAFNVIGEAQLAIDSWKQVLQIKPKHEKALESLAIVYLSNKEMEGALPFLRELVNVNPDRSRYFGRLAFVFGQTGEMDMAVAAGKRALELDPSLMQTHEWIAEVYRRMGQMEEAKKHAELVNRFQQSFTQESEEQ